MKNASSLWSCLAIAVLSGCAGVASLSCGGAGSVTPASPTASGLVVMAASPREPGAREGRVDPACPFDTYWDGLACAHARATCGGWDGVACQPGNTTSLRPEVEKSEFERLDGEAHAICSDERETSHVYSGTAPDVVRAVDEALGRAGQISQSLGKLREASQTARWEVATYARLGSLYDCIWNRMRGATPAPFTPQQDALLVKLRMLAQRLNNTGQPVPAPPIMQGQIAAVRQAVADKWRFTRDSYLAALEKKMVQSVSVKGVVAFFSRHRCGRAPRRWFPDRVSG